MKSEFPRSNEDPPVQYVWHPAIEAILWLQSWALFAASTGVVWDFVVDSRLRPNHVLARAAIVALALLMLTILTVLTDLLGAVAQWAWDNYDWSFARNIVMLAAVAFLAIAAPYVWFVVWFLKWTWPRILPIFMQMRWDIPKNSPGSPGLIVWTVLTAVTITLFWFAFVKRRNPFYSYHRAFRTLGLRRCIKGMCLVAWLRTLVPRRDFFMQAPLISWMPWLAVAILIYESIPIRLFAVTIPILFLIILTPSLIAPIAPPQWIFLGASEFESFRMFYELRGKWQRHGLTLLDRTNAGGRQFYNVWRSSIGNSSAPYDPSIGRVWSLRTRPRMWRTAVRMLAAFVPVIVVDQRQPSAIVQWEAEWLTTRGFLDKVYTVVTTEQVQKTMPSKTGMKVLDEETLIALHWTEVGLRD